ncbi:MAG: hypothetical protein PHD76_07680 [Methylacidiphilales bacterium]|nr:hypothetical protein [Candidatus Methylacidiphilales bacterium]
MKLELTRREAVIVIFLLSLLVLGATIHLIRTGADWNKPPGLMQKK